MDISVINRISIIKTLYVNFRALPFSRAIYLPIIVGKGVSFRKIGKIDIPYKVSFNMLSLGYNHIVLDRTYNRSVIENYGTIVINGKTIIRSGLSLRTDKNAIIQFGDNIEIGANAVIIATKSIVFKDNLSISWNFEALDSDMHYTMNTQTGECKDKSRPIVIGNNVWIGNNCSIGKGVHIFDGCILASFSVLKKTFEVTNSVLAGVPAKVVASNYTRVFDIEEEAKLNKKYGH